MSARRVTASDRIRSEIDGLFADPERELGEVLAEVAGLSEQLVMQAALEAEATEFLGRDRYARVSGPGPGIAAAIRRAVLDRAVAGWRGITHNPADVRLLPMMRRDLGLPTQGSQARQ